VGAGALARPAERSSAGFLVGFRKTQGELRKVSVNSGKRRAALARTGGTPAPTLRC